MLQAPSLCGMLCKILNCDVSLEAAVQRKTEKINVGEDVLTLVLYLLSCLEKSANTKQI